MTTLFKIEESTAFLARREPTVIKAATLSSAKRTASKMQCFNGTVMHIYNENGDLLAHKTPYCGGQQAIWHNH